MILPDRDRKRILVTGSAGFIGFHVARRLLESGHEVVGIDGFTSYYDVGLKRDRNAVLAAMDGFELREFMLEDSRRLTELFAEVRPQHVIHLAAQAGVRYGLDDPRSYISANIVGTFNLLEACREMPPRHLLMASSSSVYGAGPSIPFKENAETSRPLSLYAATKKAGEVISHAYSHLHSLPITAFRFFTVYGPWGRPDMAPFKFTSAILEGREIEVYGEGKMLRDFTYIDDVVHAITGLLECPPDLPGSQTSASPVDSPVAPFRAINIGASQPVELEDFIAAIEQAVGRKAIRKYLPMQPGDVRRTHADTSALASLVPIRSPTPMRDGVAKFVDWYLKRYNRA